MVDGKLSAWQTAAAQKATRPPEPESLAWEALKEQWRADTRGLLFDRGAHYARAPSGSAHRGAQGTAHIWPRWPRTSIRRRSLAQTW